MSEEYNNGGPPLKHIIPFWEKATMTLVKRLNTPESAETLFTG